MNVLGRFVYWLLGGRGPSALRPTGAPTARLADTKDATNAMVAAILELRAASNAPDRDTVQAAIDSFKLKTDNILDQRERASEIRKAEDTLLFLSTKARLESGERLTPVGTMPDGDANFFRASSVSLERRREDDSGSLDMSEKAMFYDGCDKRLTLPWGRILTMSVNGSTLLVHRTTAGEPFVFGVRSGGQARLAHLVASHLRQAATANKKKRSAKRDAEPTAGTPALEQEIARLKKQIRTERIVDRGGRPPQGAVKLSALPIGDATHRDLGSSDGFTRGIVGESHRQSALRDLDGGRLQRGEQVNFIVALIPEPENTYDKNAIRVEIQGGGQIGYLSRDDASEYHDVFRWLAERNVVGVARAKLIGGVVGKPSIGVMIDILESVELLASLTREAQPF
jgi:HIRAN domain